MPDTSASGLNINEKRRRMLKLIAGIPLGAMLADPGFSAEAECCLEDVEITAGPAGRKVRAALAMPDKTPAAAIILFHEWWGLNAQIRTVALDLAAKQGLMALAVDLYGGGVATTPEAAQALMSAVNPAEATETCVAWLDWLKGHSGCNGKLATIGWCFGGGWSLNASLAVPVDATVIYYGNVKKTADQLKSLKGPVLGHFAKRDQWINEAMVSGFEAEMAKAGNQLTAYRYDADHAFANPTGDHYNRADANLAWRRTTEFLKANLGA